ncbi:MAG: LOG family protein [Candidatus Omnitrophica bacterium]|nr:LOG family protein [Candidatus Omnitrophota bacterium]
MPNCKAIAVFGSSQIKEDSHAYKEARELGFLLAKNGITVINGGYRGVMEASSRGAEEAGGRSIGVTVATFPSKANSYLTEEIKMTGWKDRVFKLMDLADGYVLFEGGTGTLVELAIVWEMAEKGLATDKPVILLGKCWKETVEFLEKVNPYIRKRSDSIKFAASPKDVLQVLTAL